MSSRSTIVIMADFGNGPFAWLRRPNVSPPACGSNIADAVSGFPAEYGVSKELDDDLKKWVVHFENHYDKPSFDWKEFNESGIRLAGRLKEEVGDSYLVEYHVPMEDPNYSEQQSIIQIPGTASETLLELLLAYCQEKDRVCPMPQKWTELWELLPERKRKGAGWEPSLPLILAAWHDTPATSKMIRFRQHIEWAHKHGTLDRVSAYLRNLSEGDWFHVDD